MLETKKQSAIPIKSVVFATDFLESSRLALDYGVAFAHHYHADLTIVHVFELSREAQEAEMISHRPSLSREHALARLEAFASGVRRLGISTEIDLREGEPCTAVLGAAADHKADLLVLGTHGVLRGLQHLVIGSNAEKILLSAHCPTLTVGRHVLAGIDLELNFKELLYVSDCSPESVGAAQYAAALGRDLGIPIELIPATPGNAVASSDYVRAAVERFCAQLAAQGEFPERQWCNPEYHLERIASTEEILRRSTACADSLMVLGVHSESRWNRHLHTSFAYQLLAKAGCPLLSVHGALIRT